MPCGLQCLERGRGVLFFHQYVVRVKGRNRKNGDAMFSQRIDERCQNSGQRERERTFKLETSPRAFALCVRGAWSVGQTIESSSAVRVTEMKSAFRSQFWIGGIRR